MQNDFPADKPIGIIIMVLSVCCTLLGAAATLGMGAFGAALAGAAAEQGDSQSASAIMGFAGAAAVVVGLILIVSGALGVVVGYGIMKSAKWGFIMGIVVYGLSTLMNLMNFNVFGLLFAGAILTYCILRIAGSVGPKPA